MSAPLETEAGKITVTTLVSLMVVFVLGIALDGLRGGHVAIVNADNASTSVTVLNTPPAFTVDAYEYFSSSTTTPTNVGTSTWWTGTAVDSNGENYFLLICNNGSAPTAVASGPPECNGGSSNRFARSATTTSGQAAFATRVALAGDAESNAWFAFVCDSNAGTPRCENSYTQGTSSLTGFSPFMVNHRPNFASFTDDSPTLPGSIVTFTSSSSDPDLTGTQDTVRLFVCKSNSFDISATSNPQCTGGASNTWASSTAAVSNAATSTRIVIPTVDTNYNAYGFIVDNHGLAASGGAHGTDSTLTVANAAPYVSTSSIFVLDTDDLGDLTLTVEEAETTGFSVVFDVNDDNSCTTSASTTEITSTDVNIYRSGIGRTGCDATGEYNPNNCYPDGLPTATWNISCSQVAGSCSGPSDPVAQWECTFPLWYLADPTVAATQYPSENWRASIRATDDDASTGWYSDDPTGNELGTFLAFDVTGGPIVYGSLEPGDNNDFLFATTTTRATGNVGLDETVEGEDMCTTYPSCSGLPTNTIAAANQEYAVSQLSYGSGTDLSSTTPTEVELNVPKTIATTSAYTASSSLYWGIAVPGAITFAGSYVGVNTLIGVTGEAVSW